MKIKNDLMGRRFNRLLVIDEAPSIRRKDGRGTFSMWRCVCDCGKITTVRANQLICKITKSCGCLKKEVPQRTSNGPETGFIRVWCNYTGTARKRGKKFELTKDQFRKFTKQNCHYCGTEPIKIMRSGSELSAYAYNGIDRVDNKLGYVIGNCVSCCECCNKAKGTKTYEEFIRWINRLITYKGAEHGA